MTNKVAIGYADAISIGHNYLFGKPRQTRRDAKKLLKLIAANSPLVDATPAAVDYAKQVLA